MKLGIIRLYIGESGKIGFYNIQEIGLAKALAERGIATDIFFLVDRREHKQVVINEINKMIRIIYLPAARLSNHGIISPKFIQQYNLDIVHLLSDNQIMAPRFIKFCNRHKIDVYSYVGTITSDSHNKFKKAIMDIIAKRNIRCLKNICVVVKTPEVKGQLQAKGIPDIKVIPVGLDSSIIPHIEENKETLRRELNIPLDKKVLIFVGRLEAYKSPLRAIELIREIIKQRADYLLIMVGQGSLRENIIKEIESNHLENHVILIDKIENVKIHRYYKASDIFINFNVNEIFGMSILEAMNQGCKVIAMDAPGPKYIIENKINGFLMETFDTDEWINVIEEHIDNEEIGRLAVDRISSRFNWNIIAKQYIDLFEEIKRGKE